MVMEKRENRLVGQIGVEGERRKQGERKPEKISRPVKPVKHLQGHVMERNLDMRWVNLPPPLTINWL